MPLPEQAQIDATYAAVEARVRRAYAEKAQYSFKLRPVLEVGFQAFERDLDGARQMADRVLTMLEAARSDRADVDNMKGRFTERYDLKILQWLANSENVVPKRLSTAEQRNQWVGGTFFPDDYEETKRWAHLHGQIKALVAALEDQFKHLCDAKKDLRSQLWAIRLHGLLGPLGDEGRQMDEETASGFNQHREMPQHTVLLKRPI